MEYEKGYVYKLMDEGGPTDNREPYFKEAVEEMMRARVLCARANAKMPDDPSYVNDLEELFGRKLDDVRILTPFICDFGNRVKFGKGVFLNHSAILSASGGIEFEDGVMSAPGLRIASINHDMNERHTKYTYGKVLINKEMYREYWKCMIDKNEAGLREMMSADYYLMHMTGDMQLVAYDKGVDNKADVKASFESAAAAKGGPILVGVQQGDTVTTRPAVLTVYPSAKTELLAAIVDDERVNMTWLEWVNANMAQAAENVQTAQEVLAQAQTAAETAEQSAESAAIDAAAARISAQTTAFPVFSVDENGHVIISRAERLGTTTFRLTEAGHLEVTA